MRRLLVALLFLSLGQPLASAGGAAAPPLPAAEALDSTTKPLRVAVAANFRGTAELLAKRFHAESGVRVLLSSASTGILVAQLRRGAPHDVLLAADRLRPLALVAEGYARDARCYARGSLVLLGAQSLDSALADLTLSIAIANPDTAPYGAAAADVLARREGTPTDTENAKGADKVTRTRRIVRGSNVLQAYQFYRAGATDLALVARSLSPDEGIPIPREWHRAIEQYVVISAASQQPRLALSFLDYLTGQDAGVLLRERGYSLCS